MSEIITERKPRPRDRVEIRLSGGRFFAIPQAAAEMLAVGQQLSDEDVLHLDGIDQYTRGRDKAMRMLALRSRSKREIWSSVCVRCRKSTLTATGRSRLTCRAR